MYLTTTPKEISFSKEFSDGSGDRLKIKFRPDQHDVQLSDVDKMILIPAEDIEWIRKVLDHCADMYKRAHPEQPKQ